MTGKSSVRIFWEEQGKAKEEEEERGEECRRGKPNQQQGTECFQCRDEGGGQWGNVDLHHLGQLHCLEITWTAAHKFIPETVQNAPALLAVLREGRQSSALPLTCKAAHECPAPAAEGFPDIRPVERQGFKASPLICSLGFPLVQP